MSPCKSCEKRRRRKLLVRFGILLIAFAVLLTSALFANQPKQIGKHIAPHSILSFTYTYSSSVNPPNYIRYQFSMEDGAPVFRYEYRKGNHWPLTEEDISDASSVFLTHAQWQEMLSCLENGKVTQRKTQTESGDAGPWTYITWRGDKGKYQQFSFPDTGKRADFERLCIQWAQPVSP